MFSGVKDYFGNLSSKGIAAWVGGTVTAISATVGVAFLYKSGKWPFNGKKVVRGVKVLPEVPQPQPQLPEPADETNPAGTDDQ